MKTKVCSTCKEKKTVIDFYVDKNGKLGVRSICKICDIRRRTIFREKNLENHKTTRRKYYKNNRDSILEKQREYMSNGRGAEYAKNYRDKLGEHYKEYVKTRDKYKRKTDTLYRLRRAMSNLIHSAIKRRGYNKTTKTAKMLGCSWPHLKQHLEAQFQPGMSWDNYGKWHIDHIKPCSCAKNKEELMSLQSYTNLQPLWAKDNLKKGGKY